MKNFKEILVEEYKTNGSLTSIDDFKERYKEELMETSYCFEDMPLLNDVYGLSFEQLDELIKFYGSGFLFDEDVEKLAKVRAQITSIEEKKGYR